MLDWSVAYFVVLLQGLAALHLLRAVKPQSLAVRILAALFLLNGALLALMMLPRDYAIWLHSDKEWSTILFRALDAPTGPLLLAFVAARSQRAWTRALAWPLVAAGGLQAAAEILFHGVLDANDTYLRALPYYAGLGFSAIVLARSSGWERWVALALVARAAYWATAGIVTVVAEGFTSDPLLYVNRIGLLALGAATLWAVAELVRRPGEPSLGVTLPLLLVGPAAALLESGVRAALPADEAFRFGTVTFLNVLTLGLVRPVLTMVGVARSLVLPAVARAAAAAALALGALLLVTPLPLNVGQAALAAVEYGVGLCVALLALSLLMAVRPMRSPSPFAQAADGGGAPDAGRPGIASGPRPVPHQARAAALLLGTMANSLASRDHALGAPPGAAAESKSLASPGVDRGAATATGLTGLDPPGAVVRGSGQDPGTEPSEDRPQWQRLVLALAGSSGEASGALPELTQRGLVQRTGIGAPRISTLMRELNASASRRLDAYVPTWRRSGGTAREPELVRQYRGTVPGQPGVWVYYRLTPEGEQLAAALAGSSPPQASTHAVSGEFWSKA